MEARNLIAGLLIFVVILHNIQTLAAARKEPKIRRTKEETECAENWKATIGETCGGLPQLNLATREITEEYANPKWAPVKALKNLNVLECQHTLRCPFPGVREPKVDPDTIFKCECNQPPYDSSTSTCNGTPIPKNDVNKKCDNETETETSSTGQSVTDSGSGNTPSSVSDPSRNFQYILLMAIIFVIINAN